MRGDRRLVDGSVAEVVPPGSDRVPREPDEPNLQVRLEVTAGPHVGREFSFAGHDTFVVGRSGRPHFQLSAKDRYFSRFHFLVEVNPPLCRFIDMGSRDGPYPNDERATLAAHTAREPTN